MAATRKTLLNTFATQLETITKANGYNTDQHKVLRDQSHPSNKETSRIVWSLLDQGPDRLVGYADGNVTVRRMSLTIEAHIPADGLTDGVPSDKKNDAMADIFKLLYAASFATAMGASFRFLVVEDFDISIQPRRALVQSAVEMSYWLDGDTP